MNNKSKCQTDLSEGDQLEETSNNANAHHDMPSESINNHECQGSRNKWVLSHSGANDSIIPPADTVLEQDYDFVTLPDISKNMQIFGGTHNQF